MVEIKEMILNIPGISEQEGQQLAEEVAQKLASRLPEGLSTQSISEVRIRMGYPAGAGRHQLAVQIAEAIWKDVRLRMTKF